MPRLVRRSDSESIFLSIATSPGEIPSFDERKAPKQVIAFRFGLDLSTQELIAPRRPRKSQPFGGIRRVEVSFRDAGSLLLPERDECAAEAIDRN